MEEDSLPIMIAGKGGESKAIRHVISGYFRVSICLGLTYCDIFPLTHASNMLSIYSSFPSPCSISRDE